MSDSTSILRPRKWEDFQHYKDRRPPWIKLHKALLDDREYQRLPIASRALAPMLWLLASESEDGAFNGSIDELTFRLRQSAKDVEAGLYPLIDAGFFLVEQDASGVLAHSLQLAIPEKRREETETEAIASSPTVKSAEEDFNLFYKKYPKKVAKPAALKAFKAANVNGHLPDLLADIDRRISTGEWSLDQKRYIPNPATYLNGKRWEDEPSTAAPDSAPWAGAR